MGTQARRFLEKKKIDPSRVMYMTRDGRKSILHMEDGGRHETFLAQKVILEDLPQTMFESINKGIVIAPKYVEFVKDNVYCMADGTSFKGRVRITKAQKQNAVRYNEENGKNPWEEIALVEHLPLAFCVIELVFDENGHGVDFIVRYCNQEMEKMAGKKIMEMQNRSFYEIFEKGDKKWMVTYADVAVNGGRKVIEKFSPEIGARLRVYCYQVKPDFCACVMLRV